jgi:GAF domain-containing protein
MTCPRCQQDNPSHANFCPACGVHLRSTGESGPSGTPYAELQRALAEAQEQQTAAGDILRVISGSHTDVQPVFDVIAQSAARLCAADTSIFRVAGERLVFVAHHGPIAQRHGEFSLPLSRGTVGGRSVLESRTVQVADLQQEDREFSSEAVENARRFGFRTILSVPLLREGIAIGGIQLRRTEVEPFSDGQVALLQTFADQAVIAIENVRLFKELEARNRDLTTALDQQTATSEILQVIARSPTDVQPVFDAIAASATRLCEALNGLVVRFDGQLLHLAAHHNVDPERLGALLRAYPRPANRGSVSGRVVITRAVVHVEDVNADPEYMLPVATTVGYRTALGVPMLREGAAIGLILVARDHAAPFSDKQIALLKTFADQAVIAIENVRLFRELQTSNRELALAHGQVTDALEKQTATGEILKTIAQAQTNAQPVFDTIVQSAARLCKAAGAGVFLTDGGTLYHPANHGVSPEALVAARARYPRPLDMTTTAGMAILTRSVVQVPDVEEPSVSEHARQIGGVLGIRSFVSVPMLREGEAVGAINVIRRETGLFSDAEVELLQTFASQAVIAIENVRLFKELETRNSELTEALEQQTATAEILRVISQSHTDVQPVFDTIVTNAVRLCGARMGAVYRYDGDLVHLIAHHNYPPEALDILQRMFPGPPQPNNVAGRVIITRTVAQIEDVLDDPLIPREIAVAGGWRSILAVPMLREGTPIGAIVITRSETGRFADNHVQLLKTFADQAVIAIENVRLFKELEARTTELTRSVEQLTALGQVSRAVTSTLDVETVLETVVSRARQLAGADGCLIYEYDEGSQQFHSRASDNLDAAYAKALRAAPLRKGEGVSGRAAEAGEAVQVANITEPSAYQSSVRDITIQAGYRAVLSVPLLREEEIIGSLILIRKTPGEFSAEIVELLKTFATQSALAIQNARLFREIADKSRQLEAASRHKSEFLANMSHELRTPLNAIIGFSEVLSERMFGELNEKQDEYLRDIYASGQHLLSLINDILDLSKIEAGRMELEVAEFSLPVAVDNALILVRERASRRGIKLGRAIDDRVGMIRGDERKVKQVLLNLLSNALKFTPEGGRIDVRAAINDGMAEISVADTGVGIAPEDQEAIFEEFRQVGTADKKVEGTGLGLALSRKFIELHGGRIWVHSQPGKGSTFSFTLPA